MPLFAIIEKGKVSNVVIASKAEIVQLFKPDALIVEETESTGVASIGTEYINEKFVPVAPAKSWKFNLEKWKWVPPIPYPKDGGHYYWSDSKDNWELVPEEL